MKQKKKTTSQKLSSQWTEKFNMLILWTDFCKLQKLVFLFIKKDLTFKFKYYIINYTKSNTYSKTLEKER